MLLWFVKPHLGQIVAPAQEPSIVENTHQVMAAEGLGTSQNCCSFHMGTYYVDKLSKVAT